jgi:tRNA(Leu) C34 or U34 (ribose-2'-O)-methylase TrmL
VSHHNNRPNPANQYSILGLYNPKNAFNVGACLRAAGCFGSKMVIATGDRYTKKGDFRHMDSDDIHKKIPFISGVSDLKSFIPHGCVPVAVELSRDANSLVDYEHPDHAFYIFGPEDNSIPDEVTSWCRDKIYIPMDFCANLAATTYIVLYDRMAKMSKKKIITPICPRCGGTHYVDTIISGISGDIADMTIPVHRKCNACGYEGSKENWIPAQGVSAIDFGLDDGKPHEPLTDSEWKRVLELGWSIERMERLWGPLPPEICQTLTKQQNDDSPF